MSVKTFLSFTLDLNWIIVEPAWIRDWLIFDFQIPEFLYSTKWEDFQLGRIEGCHIS